MYILQQLVGVTLPIVQAPMAGAQGSSLVVAVCNYTFPAVQLNAARYEAPKDARKLMRFSQ
jgi:NAD(P)H-dependent flavin oxidoreductase YrpB (nitropropane dioxygenase family)